MKTHLHISEGGVIFCVGMVSRQSGRIFARALWSSAYGFFFFVGGKWQAWDYFVGLWTRSRKGLIMQ